MRTIVLVVFAALTARLAGLQVLSGGRYASLATNEVSTTVQVPALRGGLFDRDGAVLALSVPRTTIVGDPYLTPHPGVVAADLAPILHEPESQLQALLSEKSGFVYLARRVDDRIAAAVAALQLPGVALLPDTQRIEPDGDLAAPVLGGVDAAGEGSGGLEYQYNSLLSGVAATIRLQSAPSGVLLPGSDPVGAQRPGSGLELTLDQPLQYVTENALRASVERSHALSGIAVVMDSDTGDILSMADLAADPTTGTVVEAPSNLALTQVYEPGSVFKVATFSAALESGIISPDEIFTVPNSLTIDGWVFHDAESHPTEELSATQILAQSSNVGTIEIAEQVGPDRLAAEIAALGFGRPTGLDFPGESAGLVKADPGSWTGSDLGSTPIGQDDAVTAQQVLDMINTVATGGMFVAPRLVRATLSPEGSLRVVAASPRHRVLSPAVSAELTTMMEQVVQDGTAVSAGVPGYVVAGKTGTAQIPDPVHGGYLPGAYMATFAGFAPAQHPVLSAIVVLERPTPIFGGVVAAPVFSQVMRYALHRYGIPASPGG